MCFSNKYQDFLSNCRSTALAVAGTAEQGNADAQNMLGRMYTNGDGVPQDLVKAYAWHNVSSDNGDLYAVNFRDEVAKTITPDQIDEAMKLSRKWFEEYQSKD